MGTKSYSHIASWHESAPVWAQLVGELVVLVRSILEVNALFPLFRES